MERLGQILRNERDRRGWPQERLAVACGVTRQQLSRYETGATTPSWATFNRVLAALRVQPRIELEPLDADVVAEIARQRRKPIEDWLIDVSFAASMLHRLLTGLEWRASGLFAVRLLGGPVRLPELEAAVVLDEQGWDRLVQNARARRMEVWDPDDGSTAMPVTTELLRRTYEADQGMLRWRTGTDAWLTLRVVSAFDGPAVVTEVGGFTWPVIGLDQLDFDDPWMRRVLRQLRQVGKSDDSAAETA